MSKIFRVPFPFLFDLKLKYNNPDWIAQSCNKYQGCCLLKDDVKNNGFDSTSERATTLRYVIIREFGDWFWVMLMKVCIPGKYIKDDNVAMYK